MEERCFVSNLCAPEEESQRCHRALPQDEAKQSCHCYWRSTCFKLSFESFLGHHTLDANGTMAPGAVAGG
jgi:hypothetical protein